eukprot:TRINITY_DN44476_c0_g1_i1.p1 TRINITY_DN44476_c0_g1~~TRINITY_DN44476_c0_g1_i1.p1  ORF type:complete len:618 (+),score=110.31 TRINITY_DN44476_c0_g1_i1:140-1855(+)
MRDYAGRGGAPPHIMPPTRSDSPDLSTSRDRRLRHARGSRPSNDVRESLPDPASAQKAGKKRDSQGGPPAVQHSTSPPRESHANSTHSTTLHAHRASALTKASRPSEGTPDGSPLNLIAFRSVDTFPSPSVSLGTQSQVFPTGWFHSQFRTVGELGKGNYGHVTLAQHNLDQMPYAIKVVDTVIRSHRDLSRRLDEGKVLARCASSYIVRYFSCWIEERRLYLQCEYCPGGTLDERISHFRSQNIKWLESAVVSLLLQMTLALYHLHFEVKVAHLDVKPGNIFIGGDGKFKLGDFGHAHFLEEAGGQAATAGSPHGQGRASRHGAAHVSRSRDTKRNASLDSFASISVGELWQSLEEGDVRYLPLEMLNDKSNLIEADIFALGVSLYEVSTGSQLPRGDLPWRALRERGIDRDAILGNIKIDCTSSMRERFNSQQDLCASMERLGCGDEGDMGPMLAELAEGDSLLVGIIGKMMDKEPKKRPSAKDLLTQYRPLFSSKCSNVPPPISAEYLMALDKARSSSKAAERAQEMSMRSAMRASGNSFHLDHNSSPAPNTEATLNHAYPPPLTNAP